MEYRRFPRGESCSTSGCRSRRYYEEAGSRFCKDHGHRQEGFTQVLADEDDFENLTKGRKSRIKREIYDGRGSGGPGKLLEGSEAKEMFLLCLQLVLRKQCWQMAELLGLEDHKKSEYEGLVRDLWTVRIRNVNGLTAGGGGQRGGNSSAGDDSQSEGRSVYSSGTSDPDSDSGSGKSMASLRKRKVRKHGVPRLIETLSLCYLGCILLRLPVSLGEVLKWVQKDQIVHLRVTREIPTRMHSVLPGYYAVALETRTSFRPDVLQKVILDQAITLRIQAELILPPLNAPLLAFKHIKSLCLPLDVYAASKNLGKALGLDYSWPSTPGRYQVSAWPEVSIMGLVVIATKLFMGLDEVKRIPQSSDDPTVLTVDWEKWKAEFKESSVNVLTKGQELQIQSEDVLNMTEENIDRYMDWHQKIWHDSRDPKMPEQILELFQLEELPPQEVPSSQHAMDEAVQAESRLKDLQHSLRWTKHIPIREDDEREYKRIRPGMMYRHWRTVSDLTPTAHAFYEQAAKISGVRLNTMVRAVFLLELQLQKLVGRRRQNTLAEEWDGTEDNDEEGEGGETSDPEA